MVDRQKILELASGMRSGNNRLRMGQSIFNAAYSLHPVETNHCQFVKGIDCFYNDSKIEAFLKVLEETNNVK